MRELIGRFRPCFAYAALFSVVVNLLLLVPAMYMLQIFDRVISSRNEATLVMLTMVALFALGSMSVLDAVRARLLAAAAAALDRHLGPKVLDGLLGQTARLSGADHLNGLRDVNTIRAFLLGPGVLAVFDAPWMPLYIALIFVFHPVLGIFAICGAAVMVGIAVANERFTRKPLERVQAEARKASKYVDSAVRNAEVATALGMLPALTRRWAVQNDRVLREQALASATGGAFSSATKFTRQLVQIVMLATGAYLVVDQQASPGIMMASSIILGRALAPVELLVGSWKVLVELRSALERLSKLLAAVPHDVAGLALPAPRGALMVDRLVFGLRQNERPILRGVSFALEPGESLGLIGPSAAGKSTLARLIVGVWKPGAGHVRLDGADVSTWPRERLGPYIGYLPQDVELFAATVAENIARLEEPDSAAVIRAAQRAGVHEMILRLPKGYDTEVGEGGAGLSPGQRQRIGLARALYRDPKLVVLDEPNANLDNEGDAALMHALRDLKQSGVTTLVIAHRPSLLSGVDKLLVLRDGAVEMFGPRAEIMARVTRGTPQIGVAQ